MLKYTYLEIMHACRIRSKASTENWQQSCEEIASLLACGVIDALYEHDFSGTEPPNLSELAEAAHVELLRVAVENRRLDRVYDQQFPRNP